ncbi:MAG TPA: SDR family NAD(P)-dependent oxidoreductase [Solirubrobacteraceae bacterium]|nr:SDR family NAD(P)-dependent oxidoreductase [Solirubrobacteraceae bacterium]
MGRMDGKVVAISGTGGGQGRAAAVIFAREGAAVVGCDIKVEGSAETVEMVEAAGGTMTAIAPLDLSLEESNQQWIDTAIEKYGRLDVLYNNASRATFGPIEELTAETWRFTIANELDLVYYASRAAWPHLKESRGAIVSIASAGAVVGARGFPSSVHAAAKGGVVAFSRQLAADGAQYRIRSNSICPGFVRSPATVEFFEGPMKPYIDNLPLGRAAEGEDIAYAALFLASDEASYITGANLVVDGGATSLV